MAERPDRVSIPGILSEHASRLRALERSRPGFVPPKGDDFIELWDEGVPQGLVKALDFVGSGVQALTTGDERGIVNISGGGAGGWDAIVDGSVAASDPDNRLFKGIGEALSYLKTTLGMTRAAVFVRSYAYPGYVETANWTNPAQVLLFGAPGAALDYATWGHGTFNGESAGWLLYNMAVGAGVKARMFTGSLNAYNCQFTTDSLTSQICSSFAYYTDVVLSRIVQLGQDMVSCKDVEVLAGVITSSGTASVTIVGGTAQRFVGNFKVMAASATGTANCDWVFPGTTILDFEAVNNTRLGGSAGGWTAGVTLKGSAGTSGANGIMVRCTGLNSYRVSVSSAAGTKAVLMGHFRDITIAGAGAGQSSSVQAEGISSGTIDITGPCSLDLGIYRQVTLRGRGVTGHIFNVDSSPMGDVGAMIRYVACTRSVIDAALDATGSTGTSKPYSLDASSHGNVLVLADKTNVLGVSTFPSAGTDAGTNNRILPEGAAPPAAGFAPADAYYLVGTANGTLTSEIVVGPTPGGELGNTWAAPTVDATHSGSAHTDFIAKAFFDAKGDLISATADDTPAIVPVGADGEVLTADSTDPAGVSWQPGGGSMTFGSPVESQFGDTGSDGIGTDAARDDHVHDRHDDGVLFFSGINH